MEFLVIAYSILVFALVLVVLGLFGKKSDLKRKRLDAIEREKLPEGIYNELNGTFFSRILVPVFSKARKAFQSMIPKDNKSKPKANNAQLERQLRLAGIYIEPQEFNFIKSMITIIALAIVALLALILDISIALKLLILLFGLIIAIILPMFFLRSKVNSHQNGIRKQLPDTLDMLCVCMEAGLSFDGSLMKISEKMNGPFIDELMIVYREIQMGRSRREAILSMSNNTDIDELKTFASSLAQAEKLGIPINNVLRVQSKQLRTERSQQAKEKGMKASIKMLIPMMIFILPTVFIILLGPTVMNIIQQFS